MNYLEQLIALIEKAERWPLDSERHVFDQVNLWAAFRESDAEALRPADWGKDTIDGRERDYIVDPLAARIAGAKADLVFGEDPTFTPAEEADAQWLAGIVEGNDLPSQLQNAERICASEGEVWWRVFVNAELDAYPCIQWLSRAYVVPLFYGRKLVACAFVSVLSSPDKHKKPKDKKVWRHVEVQAEGQVRNLLYVAEKPDRGVGKRHELADHPETAGLREEWDHGLEMLLAGRVLNDEGTDPHVGVSDFKGVRGLLYALNEATSIGVENARLTGKKRAVVPRRFLDKHGNFPVGVEIIVATETDANPDKPQQGLAQIEWEFDAEALIRWHGHIEDTTLTRTRTAPQLVGRHTEGAQTGPALRARLLDSVLDAHGKGRYWDDELPNCLLAAQLVDALPREQGGLGQSWTAAAKAPAVERQSILPEEEGDKIRRHTEAVGALLESRETAIRDLRPEWDDDQIRDEMKRITDENSFGEA